MKLMICNGCGELVTPEKVGNWQWCICGNIGGMYSEPKKFQAAIRDKRLSRVVEVCDDVLHGKVGIGSVTVCESSDITIIPYDDAIYSYQFRGIDYSNTLILDFAKVIGIIPADGSPCFSERLFEIILNADQENRQKLRRVYPCHVDMVNRYQFIDGVIQHPMFPDAGAYVPLPGGGFSYEPGK